MYFVYAREHFRTMIVKQITANTYIFTKTRFCLKLPIR